VGDEIDRAQAYDEFFLGLALRNRNVARGRHEDRGARNEERLEASNLDPRTSNLDPSSSNLDPRSSNLLCIDCGEEIPEARRRAVPGCRRCVDCQSLHENWRPV
jgi:phage/conjugal plasmid C-4 type zinc finger TraR family protein